MSNITHVLLIVNPKDHAEVLRAAAYDHYPSPEARADLLERFGCSGVVIDGDNDYVKTMQWIYERECDTGRMRL